MNEDLLLSFIEGPVPAFPIPLFNLSVPVVPLTFKPWLSQNWMTESPKEATCFGQTSLTSAVQKTRLWWAYKQVEQAHSCSCSPRCWAWHPPSKGGSKGGRKDPYGGKERWRSDALRCHEMPAPRQQEQEINHYLAMNIATATPQILIRISPSSSSGGEQGRGSMLTSSPRHRYTWLMLFPSASDLPLGNFRTPFGHKHKRDVKGKADFGSLLCLLWRTYSEAEL